MKNTLFITMQFTSRERYCKAVRHLWANADKYIVVNRGKDYNIKAPRAVCGWYIDFYKI